MSEPDWFREEYERAKALNDLVPRHARMVVCGPGLTRPSQDAAGDAGSET